MKFSLTIFSVLALAAPLFAQNLEIRHNNGERTVTVHDTQIRTVTATVTVPANAQCTLAGNQAGIANARPTTTSPPRDGQKNFANVANASTRTEAARPTGNVNIANNNNNGGIVTVTRIETDTVFFTTTVDGPAPTAAASIANTGGNNASVANNRGGRRGRNGRGGRGGGQNQNNQNNQGQVPNQGQTGGAGTQDPNVQNNQGQQGQQGQQNDQNQNQGNQGNQGQQGQQGQDQGQNQGNQGNQGQQGQDQGQNGGNQGNQGQQGQDQGQNGGNQGNQGQQGQDQGQNGGNNNEDPQTSLTLDPRVINEGFAQDGQGTPTPGQVRSLTSTNNFINFCLTQPVPITNGQQIRTGSCNPIPMGRIIARDRLPSCKFVFPLNFSRIPANQPFTVKLKLKNLQAGAFTNAQTTYYGAPAEVNDQGILIGHSHVVIEQIKSLADTDATDPTRFAFFKGLNAPLDAESSLSALVDKGLPAGVYRMFSINTAANHQPALGSVAQHGSFDDGVYFTAE